MIYMDNSAGTRVYPEVIETITDVLQNHWGNASADYSFGSDARGIIDEVTEQVASDINCKSEEIIWTSGACEANSLAITGVLGVNPHMHFYTTHLEHASITEIVKNNPTGSPIFFIDNNKYGQVSTSDLYNKLEESYNSGTRMLVSISFANSEIGVIQDIGIIANIVHEFGGILHVDATQMYPWERIDVQELGIDLMSVSGQKMHAPKGIGFLFVRDGIKLKPTIYGSQQAGRRGGTYPTHLIAAFGKALEINREHNSTLEVEILRNALLDRLLQIDGVKLNGPSVGAKRLPNNVSLTIDGVKAETLITMCSMLSIYISKSSACQSYIPTPSKTLLAIGVSKKKALNTVRITLDEFNTQREVEDFIEILQKLIARIRDASSK